MSSDTIKILTKLRNAHSEPLSITAAIAYLNCLKLLESDLAKSDSAVETYSWGNYKFNREKYQALVNERDKLQKLYTKFTCNPNMELIKELANV